MEREVYRIRRVLCTGLYFLYCKNSTDIALTSMFMIAVYGFVVCMAIKLAVDLQQFHSRKTINHALEAVFVAIALAALSFLAGWKSAGIWFFGWWMVFDFMFNVLVGNPPFYVGETAWLDKLQRKYPVLQFARYVLFIGSVIFFIYA